MRSAFFTIRLSQERSSRKTTRYRKELARIARLILFLQKDNSLQTGNLDSLAAPRITASDHVIDSHHVIPGLFESCTIFLIGARRQRLLFRAAYPPDLVFGGLPARGAINRV